jgi:hypothetical protein
MCSANVIFNIVSTQVFPLAEEAKQKLQKQLPPKSALITLTTFMGFSRSVKTPQLKSDYSSAKRAIQTPPIILEAIWRQTTVLTEMPSDWWRLVCPNLSTCLETSVYTSNLFKVT